MSDTQLTVNSFGADLLATLSDADADSPLHKIDTSDAEVKFLPKFTVNKDRFTIKARDGDIVRNDPSQPMIIHWAHPYPQRMFYIEEFDAKNPTPPDCGSNGAAQGEVECPDPSVANPQSERCDTCEWNKNGCKMKQNIIVSEKVHKGTPQLMLMTCNATTVFNRDGADQGLLGLNAYLKEVAKTGKNLHQFITKFSIWPDGNCMVKFSPEGACADPEDPNMLAHEKVKESLNMTELCAMDFTPWKKDEDSDIDNPAPSTTVNEAASKDIDKDAQKKSDAKVDSASDAVDAFLKNK